MFTENFREGLRRLQRAILINSSVRKVYKDYLIPKKRIFTFYFRNEYKKFFQTFGTHFMREVWLGATLTTEIRFASSSTSSQERYERAECIEKAFSDGLR